MGRYPIRSSSVLEFVLELGHRAHWLPPTPAPMAVSLSPRVSLSFLFAFSALAFSDSSLSKGPIIAQAIHHGVPGQVWDKNRKAAQQDVLVPKTRPERMVGAENIWRDLEWHQELW